VPQNKQFYCNSIVHDTCDSAKYPLNKKNFSHDYKYLSSCEVRTSLFVHICSLHRSRRSRTYKLGIGKSGSTIDDNVVGTALTYRDTSSFTDSTSVTDSGMSVKLSL